MKNFLAWLSGTRIWKSQWQSSLSDALKKAQDNLSLNLVVVVARESDLYTEILYFLSFLGLLVGTVFAFYVRSVGDPNLPDPLVFPLLGYTAGSLAHVARRYFLKHWFQRLARIKVYVKAQGYFVDYTHRLPGRVALLYLSETEQVAALITNPDVQEKLPHGDLEELLGRLERNYRAKDPLHALEPALENLSILLKSYAPELDSSPKRSVTPPIYVGASDYQRRMIPVLRSNKDIN
ncbi:MAG: hypothetical protein ABIR96_03350 [Bdellovibrionota bacterium]